MPIHDWTRVGSWCWHDFHLAWIAEVRRVLNGGLLPEGYYALAEQITGRMGPDVLTLQSPESPEIVERPSSGGVAVATAPPRPGLVALIEIFSPGNKSGKSALCSFVEKAAEALHLDYHLLIIDLFSPTPRDPQGIPGAIWEEFTGATIDLPADGPLTLSAFSAGQVARAYVEGTAVGRALIAMPLFLEPEIYVNVPLEETYEAAYQGVPQRC